METFDLSVLFGLILSALVIFIIYDIRGIGGIVGLVVKVGIVVNCLAVRHLFLGVVTIKSMFMVGLDFHRVLVQLGCLLGGLGLPALFRNGRLLLGLGLLLLDRRLVPLAEHIVDLPDARVGGGEGVGLDVLPLLLLEAEILDEDPEEVGVLGQPFPLALTLSPAMKPLTWLLTKAKVLSSSIDCKKTGGVCFTFPIGLIN